MSTTTQPRLFQYPVSHPAKGGVRFTGVSLDFLSCFIQAAARTRLSGFSYAEGELVVDLPDGESGVRFADTLKKGFAVVESPVHWKDSYRNSRVPVEQVEWVVTCAHWFLGDRPEVTPMFDGHFRVSHNGYAA